MVRSGIVGLAFFATIGCAVESVTTPPLTGPSELSLSLAITLERDTILQDGQATSMLRVLARDTNAQPKANVPLRIDILVPSPSGGLVAADFGTLTNRWPTTDAQGVATALYQAPTSPANGPSDSIVTFLVTPVGDNYTSALSRSIELRLVKPGIILPPNGAPVPSFFFSPSTIREDETVTFDASASTDDGQIVAYVWSFGDGSGGTGKVRSHAYPLAGTYQVTLTVTDDRGTSVSTPPTPVTIGTSANPVASFTMSPTAPAVGTSVLFNAATSTVPTGRTLVGFDWDFGDGSQASGVTATHTYAVPGTFTVVLTVTDNTGRKGVTSRTVSIVP